MKRLKIVAKQKKKRIRTTFAVPVTGANLCKECLVTTCNQLWAADITYVQTGRKWLYLAIILDVYSRKIVGYAISDHMRVSFALEALENALLDRQPAAGWIHHSDRGSQYASSEYRESVTSFGGRSSFSGKHKPNENAYAESFFKTLKTEEVYANEYITRHEAEEGIRRFIEYYNTRRLHTGIGSASPEEFEMDKLTKNPA
jgi:transposase InsO family protein